MLLLYTLSRRIFLQARTQLHSSVVWELACDQSNLKQSLCGICGNLSKLILRRTGQARLHIMRRVSLDVAQALRSYEKRRQWALVPKDFKSYLLLKVGRARPNNGKQARENNNEAQHQALRTPTLEKDGPSLHNVGLHSRLLRLSA